ncbi:MAG: GtrA family protein [Clostridia bacterium]|nr:GtrA family protein [Clostridia bacterium]
MTEEARNPEQEKQPKDRSELIRTIKFVLFSISAGVIEFGSFELLNILTPWSYWVKHIISIVLSVLWNFTLNREFTFRSANNVPIAMLKVAAFYAVFILVTTIMGNYLVQTCGWDDTVVKILTMLLNFVTEYLYDRFVVFGKSIDTNSRAQAKGKE